MNKNFIGMSVSLFFLFGLAAATGIGLAESKNREYMLERDKELRAKWASQCIRDVFGEERRLGTDYIDVTVIKNCSEESFTFYPLETEDGK